MADTKGTKISFKVVTDREKENVVFAEANSDFVNILFSFLTFPMGTTIRLLANRSDPSHQPVNIGSFNNLYRSVANLDLIYFGMKECKDMLLNTRNSAEAQCQNLKINIDDIEPIEYFICKDCNCCKSIFSCLRIYCILECPSCRKAMERAMNSNVSKHGGYNSVFATETLSFVITDDLHVIPNNPALTLGILESSGVKDFSVLKENTLTLGSKEIIDLLECSYLSKTPLSDIFFGKKRISSPVPDIQSRIRTEGINGKKMKINVFVQKSKNKILLAHSSEDFIDFLFSLLTIPLGKVFSLLVRDHESTLSIRNVHQSVLKLNVRDYLISEKVQNMLLNPKLSMHYLGSKHIFPLEEEKAAEIFYNGKRYSAKLKDRQIPIGQGGCVQGSTKYMVTDDLVVTPLSSMSCFTHLHRLRVTPSDIEEHVINIGMEEALNLLRASLTSTTVLTNGLGFLVKNNPEQGTSLNKPQSERLFKKPKVEK